MSNQIKIKNKISFIKNFLSPICKVSDSAVLEIENGFIKALVCTSDNSIIFHNTHEIESSSEELIVLNCSDLKKLIRALDTIVSKNEIIFTLEENNISYNDSKIKFKYHLLENDIIKKPKISLKKLESMDTLSSFIITKDSLKELVRGSVFSSDSNKFYLNSENGGVFAELTDKTRNNIDTITLQLSDSFDGNSFEALPLNFEIFRIMEIGDSNDINVKINTKLGIVLFEIYNNYNKMLYIMSSLTK